MPDDPESFTTEESGPVVLWPTVAIEGALAERERLFGIIDHAVDVLGLANRELSRPGVSDAAKASRAIGWITDVLAILAEADPIDPETGERMGDRDG